jgi:hypothetical protein
VVRESASAIGIQFLSFNEGAERALREYISARLEEKEKAEGRKR